LAVSVEKVMKGLEKEGIPVDNFDSYLLAMRNRHELISRAIRTYISRNLIITNLDAENNKKVNTRVSMLGT
jgi:hypothetical protein